MFRHIYAMLLFLGVLAPCALLYAQEDTIPSFDARVTVQSDRRVEVKEKIVYDFKDRERHGIFRVIPYSYQAETATYEARISSVMVYDGVGNPLPFIESRGNGELTVKIGDAETVVTGLQTYVLSYIVEGPFLYFPAQDEFFWNVTGVWQNGIDEANILVDLPTGAKVLDAVCFRGTAGEERACDEQERLENAQQAGYRAYAKGLAPGEGLAIAVVFPKGVIEQVEKPWNEEKFSVTALLAAVPLVPTTPFVSYILALLPCVALCLFVYRWYVRTRDVSKKKRVTHEVVPPDGVTPALAGAVYHQGIGPRTIVAELVRLATEGYLRVYRIDRNTETLCSTDYLLESSKEDRPNDSFLAALLEQLFRPAHLATERVGKKDVRGVLVSKLYSAPVAEYDAIVDRLYGDVLARGYVPEQPGAVRTRYYVFGVALCLLASVAYLLGQAALGISLFLFGLICMAAGWFVPVKTHAGVRTRERLEGFRRYLLAGEPFDTSRESVVETFSRQVPYAIALGVEREWANRFASLSVHDLPWYVEETGVSSEEVARVVRMFAVDVSVALSSPARVGDGNSTAPAPGGSPEIDPVASDEMSPSSEVVTHKNV
ncbi:MAG: DUF2207 domain-containing protein [Candidatus Pacebacteria bacterium]|nr:DUF2207 domain-containing protein [Candidatus Paceibacterota bacterium]